MAQMTPEEKQHLKSKKPDLVKLYKELRKINGGDQDRLMSPIMPPSTKLQEYNVNLDLEKALYHFKVKDKQERFKSEEQLE